ncbi:Succinyl-CoA--D-citramalate CoA-transferase [Geodia barretti]|uniref:Succinyl-CoA--D-citramalate CoA-transferase n=1 Tax=Geodia barretti TaxID=519541 RepID=A0AA35STD2_GEOBA|nr:Succinyl-CoA--D-citramalate CoA-transferase [Geodia barretti]
MGRPELGDDPRYATHSARGDRQHELDELIAAWTATLDADELRRRLDENGIPNGQMYRAPEMLADEHFAARQAIAWVDSPDFGPIPMQNIVPKLSETPGSINWSGPLLGEHNDEVLGAILGLDADAIEQLRAGGVVG